MEKASDYDDRVTLILAKNREILDITVACLSCGIGLPRLEQ
jgi:hypothetical protein